MSDPKPRTSEVNARFWRARSVGSGTSYLDIGCGAWLRATFRCLLAKP
jgi:hypothetical protein